MYLELLYEALTKPYGIVVETDNPDGLRRYLYAARVKAADVLLDQLAIVPSPLVEGELWIVRKEPDVAPQKSD